MGLRRLDESMFMEGASNGWLNLVNIRLERECQGRTVDTIVKIEEVRHGWTGASFSDIPFSVLAMFKKCSECFCALWKRDG